MTDLETIKNTDPETAANRYTACRACQNFSAAASSTQQMRDAVTGELTEIAVQTRDMCSKYNLTLEGYIGMIYSTCPEDLWK